MAKAFTDYSEKLLPSSIIIRFMIATRFVRIIGTRLFPIYKIKLPNGDVMYVRSQFGFDASTINEVVFSNIYEKFFRPEPGNVVFDVGAHIGSFSIKAAREVGGNGQVIALEPSSDNFRILNMNIEANKYAVIRPLKLAVGEKVGTARLKIYKRRGGNSFLNRQMDQVGVEEVQMTTLDSIHSQLNPSNVSFIKIDVEGYELKVLEGARNILRDFHPKIVMETHDFGPAITELSSYLAGFKYSIRSVPYGTGLGLLYAE